MTKPVYEIESDNRDFLQSGNSTELYIKEFYKRLYLSSVNQLLSVLGYSELKRMKKIVSAFDRADSLISKIKYSSIHIPSVYKHKYKEMIKEFRDYVDAQAFCIQVGIEEEAQKGTKKRGDLCLLLYLEINNAQKDKVLLRQIGEIIERNGRLHKALDRKFGEGAFDILGFPSVNVNMYRWERGPKAEFKKYAKKYVVSEGLSSTDFARLPNEKDEEYWNRIVSGGHCITQYEHMIYLMENTI